MLMVLFLFVIVGDSWKIPYWLKDGYSLTILGIWQYVSGKTQIYLTFEVKLKWVKANIWKLKILIIAEGTL